MAGTTQRIAFVVVGGGTSLVLVDPGDVDRRYAVDGTLDTRPKGTRIGIVNKARVAAIEGEGHAIQRASFGTPQAQRALPATT